ncbi:hypothetical protein K5X82_07380 [Halosquirtibacter xylanolyticus]|uniref:hypothetical protein n=1 Tax=Halosquirtibacter xylanolyticus TaxID=3374599 RepID=UPI003748B306|nr:hypothetical protein K5X82_07380 [Prolixibacteraceae bacterium]
MIGNIIRTILLDNPKIKSIVGEEIQPIKVQSEDLPAICYRVTFIPGRGKMAQKNQEYQVELVTFFDSYSDSWELSMLIHETLEEARRKEFNGRTIADLQCNSITDDYEYNLDTYGQKINFKVVVC